MQPNKILIRRSLLNNPTRCRFCAQAGAMSNLKQYIAMVPSGGILMPSSYVEMKRGTSYHHSSF